MNIPGTPVSWSPSDEHYRNICLTSFQMEKVWTKKSTEDNSSFHAPLIRTKVLFFTSLTRSAPQRIKLTGRPVSDYFYLDVLWGTLHSWPSMFYQSNPSHLLKTVFLRWITIPLWPSLYFQTYLIINHNCFKKLFKRTGFGMRCSRFLSQLLYLLPWWLLKAVEPLLCLSIHTHKLGIIKLRNFMQIELYGY